MIFLDILLNCIIVLINNPSFENKILVQDALNICSKNKTMTESDIANAYMRILRRFLNKDFDLDDKKTIKMYLAYLISETENDEIKNHYNIVKNYIILN